MSDANICIHSHTHMFFVVALINPFKTGNIMYYHKGFQIATYLTITWLTMKNFFPRFSRNSEAFASEFQEHKMLLLFVLKVQDEIFAVILSEKYPSSK